MLNIAVLIPAYNAAVTLPELLRRTVVHVPAKSIFVVDDGSTDDTGAIAASMGVRTIVHSQNRGKGAALTSGFMNILLEPFESVLTMDSDLQHLPEEIPNFVNLFQLTHADVIIGSRLHNTKGMPFHRLVSNTITTALVRMRTGIRVSDSQSGFRMISRRVIENITLQSSGFEAETEFIIKAASAGFTFGSMPIDTIYAGEKSSMTHLRTTINFLKVLLRNY